MHTPFKFLPAAVFGSLLFLAACTDDSSDPDPIDTGKPGEMSMHFESHFGSTALVLNKMMQTAGSDSVAISDVQYFISNVEFVKTDGSRYKEPNSYHLIQVNGTTTRDEFVVKNIPAGEYNKVLFQVGIDAARNSSHDAAVGDLDLNPDLVWAWANSIVFFRNQGMYYDAAEPTKRAPYSFDIGNDASLKYVTLPFDKPVVVNDTHSPEMHLNADLKAFFTSPNLINIKSNPDIAGDTDDQPDALRIAENYATMFKIAHIHAL